MTMAESACGSSPAARIRLKVSRQEMAASTRMRVDELCAIALFPRLPLAKTVTDTPMPAAYAPPLWKRNNFLDSSTPLSSQPSVFSLQSLVIWLPQSHHGTATGGHAFSRTVGIS